MDAKTHIKTAIFKTTPSVAVSKPGGRDVAKDVVEAGGVVMPRGRAREKQYHADM